jgi:aminoglycoside 6-adenylyltransferase
MRTEKEMLELILNVARSTEDVRAVVMNGSRVNPNAKKDPFQDYDIIYFVREVEPYRRNMGFIRQFGEMMILQTPEDMSSPSAAGDGHYSYLMQFMDGNRIDLSFYPLEVIPKYTSDSLTIKLLDKDRLIPQLPPASDRSYLPQPPTAKLFDDCCNEFWWCSPYVAKGLWRDQPTYARDILEGVLREELMKMLTWYFGVLTDFQKSPGKAGKYMKASLGPALWKQLEATCPDFDIQHTWDALFAMGDLFRLAARKVAQEFDFVYPEAEDAKVTEFLRDIRKLPKDAKTIR